MSYICPSRTHHRQHYVSVYTTECTNNDHARQTGCYVLLRVVFNFICARCAHAIACRKEFRMASRVSPSARARRSRHASIANDRTHTFFRTHVIVVVVDDAVDVVCWTLLGRTHAPQIELIGLTMN